MRHMILGSIVGIGLLFLGSLLVLDRLSGDEAAAPPAGPEANRRAELAPPPAPTPSPRVSTPQPTPEVARQLASPPVEPTPREAPAPLPPSGAPPAPGYVREQLGALEALVTSRCGRLSLRLGDQLRREGLDPAGHAVLLLDLEPLAGEAKIWGSTLQSAGATRPALVACAQHTLRGHRLPVTHLQPGARVKVQVVVGLRE